MEHEDMTTDDEARISTPYSDRATWAKVLMHQQLADRGNLQGPPGLREKVVSMLAPLTERERTDLYFNQGMQAELVRAVLAKA